MFWTGPHNPRALDRDRSCRVRTEHPCCAHHDFRRSSRRNAAHDRCRNTVQRRQPTHRRDTCRSRHDLSARSAGYALVRNGSLSRLTCSSRASRPTGTSSAARFRLRIHPSQRVRSRRRSIRQIFFYMARGPGGPVGLPLSRHRRRARDRSLTRAQIRLWDDPNRRTVAWTSTSFLVMAR